MNIFDHFIMSIRPIFRPLLLDLIEDVVLMHHLLVIFKGNNFHIPIFIPIFDNGFLLHFILESSDGIH